MHSNDLLTRLKICLRDGKVAEAEAILEENPNNGSVVRFFAVYYFQRGEEGEALRLIEIFRGTEQSGENYYHPEVCCVYAQYLLWDRQFGNARALLQEVVDAGRADPYAYTMYAGMLDDQQAIALLENGRQVRGGEWRFNNSLCNRLVKLYDREKAQNLLKELADAEKADSHNYTIYAGMLPYQEAITLLENARTVRDGELRFEAGICNKLAQLYSKDNRVEEAKNLLQELVNRNKASERTYVIYAGMLEVQEAIPLLESARTVRGEVLKYEAVICNTLARLYYTRNELDDRSKARQLLEGLITHKKANNHTYTTYSDMLDRDQAILFLEDAVKTEQFYYDAPICNRLAQLYCERNKGWDRYEATILLEELIYKGKASCHSYMTYSSLVDVGTAIRVLNEVPVSERDEGFSDRAKKLVDIRVSVFHKVEKLLSSGKEVEPSDLYCYATTLAHRDKIPEAISVIEKSQDPQVMALCGFLYIKMQDGKKALDKLWGAFDADYSANGEPNWFALSTITTLARMGVGIKLHQTCMDVLGDRYDIPFLQIDKYPAKIDAKALSEYIEAPIILPRHSINPRSIEVEVGHEGAGAGGGRVR